jgi:hypothetical protein
MAEYQILYWKDIPAQIKVFETGKRPIARVLPDRYQQEIDRVAMREGLHGSDAYLDQWHWGEKQDRPGSAEEVAEALLTEFETT